MTRTASSIIDCVRALAAAEHHGLRLGDVAASIRPLLDASPCSLSLAAAVELVVQPNGYISPMLQEAFILMFGDHDCVLACNDLVAAHSRACAPLSRSACTERHRSEHRASPCEDQEHIVIVLDDEPCPDSSGLGDEPHQEIVPIGDDASTHIETQLSVLTACHTNAHAAQSSPATIPAPRQDHDEADSNIDSVQVSLAEEQVGNIENVGHQHVSPVDCQRIPAVSVMSDRRLAQACSPGTSLPVSGTRCILQVVAEPHQDCLLPQQVGPPDFSSDHRGELLHWVHLLLNAPDPSCCDLWRRMPLYCQYIEETPLDEVRSHMEEGLRGHRGSRISVEQAAETPANFEITTLFPLAVAAEYAAQACGLPAAFVIDMTHALSVSCFHKSLATQPYTVRAPSFLTRARYWATPTGKPNAGKSPTHDLLKKAFMGVMNEAPHFFPFIGVERHVYSGGSHGGFKEVLPH